MRSICFLILTSFLSTRTSAQEEQVYYKNAFYGTFARQGLVHVKYERNLFTNNWTNTFINVGFGLVPREDIKDVKIITPELGQLFGYKNIYLEVGLEPSINFYDGATYVDLNGIIGLRYHQLLYKDDGLLFEIGYCPKLIDATKSLIEAPFYMGIGMSF
jgi:hypothetical protein